MSILRSSKFFRYFVSFSRNFVLSRPAEVDKTLFRNSILANSSISYSTRSLTQQKSIEKYIQRLDQDVRRSGRISRKELEEAFNEIRLSKYATSSQSLMIIRCCGNLVPEENPELRTKLVNEIWSTFEKLVIAFSRFPMDTIAVSILAHSSSNFIFKGFSERMLTSSLLDKIDQGDGAIGTPKHKISRVPFDISHYNALLRVYLENEHRFSPSEFLADLQTKGIEPNRVTYQRLIASYCQRGDIEGATRILEYMKEKQLPVNESVFNSLIMGHFQADDIESAVGILSVMKQANIKPSGDTYTTLMCGHAKNGNYAAINEVLSQCEKEDIEITDRDILEVMYTLAINDHVDLMEQLAGNLKKFPGFNQDAKNVILRLIVKGKDNAALTLFHHMGPVVSAEGENLPIGIFLIRQMVKSGRPIEAVIDVCNELKTSGKNDSGLLVATEASLVHGKPEVSSRLLSILSKEHEMCHHYYWPVLVQYGKQKNTKGITDTLLQMIDEIGQPVSGETLRDYVAPYIPQNEEGVFLLRQGGIPLATSAASMIAHLVSKNDLQTAARIGMKFKANYTSVQLCKSIVNSFIEKNDLESFISLVRVIEESGREEGSDLPGKILLDLVVSLRKNRTETITSILKAYLDSGLAISNQVADELQDKINGAELTSDIEELLSKLTSPDLIPAELNRPAPTQKRILDETHFLKNIKTANEKGDPAWSWKRQLLAVYCLNKDLEKAEELKKEMDEGGYEFMVGSNVLMMDLYVHHEKLQEALDYYNKIFQEDVEIDRSKILKLGALMVKNNMIEEAMDMFPKHKGNPDSQINKGLNLSLYNWRILNILAEKKDVENLQKMFNVLLQNNYVVPNNMVLGPFIKVHLLRDDIDSALSAFEECCLKYRATPWKNELSCKLIQKEDPVGLQKLTDLSTQIHGEMNSLYDLVLSFVECGRIRQARRILETPGLRNNTFRLNSACERYDSEGHVVHLENLVEVTKDLTHIDRAEIYYHLLSTYCKAGEVDKAVGLWTQMQDEDVQATDQFLAKLGNLLKEHNRSIPFVVPTVRVVDEPDQKQPQGAPPLALKTYRSAINSGDVDEALNSLKRLKDDELSKGDRSKLVMLLATNGRLGEARKMLIGWLEKNLKINIKVLSYVINQLAKNGDLDSLNIIGNYIDTEVKKMTSFVNRLTHCMVLAGKANEVLDILESKINAATTPEKIAVLTEEFPKGGIFSVFESYPELITRFEEISVLFREKGILEPTNILWNHYVMNGDTEKAKEAWSFLKPAEKLMFQPIIKHSRKNGDFAMITELLSLAKTCGVPLRACGTIYSAAIDIAFSLGKAEECDQLLERGIQECTIDNINRSTLFRMKKSYEINGKEFKYSIPSQRARPIVSSSSSDSDSDSERTVEKASN